MSKRAASATEPARAASVASSAPDGGSGEPGGTAAHTAALVALSSFLPAAKVNALKKTLPRGTSIDVDVTARIRGVVQIGVDEPGQPGESGTRPADPPDLVTPNLVSEVLRRLKVTPGKLRAALKAATKNGPRDYTGGEANAALLAVFDEVAQTIAEDLPPVAWSKPATAGRAAPVRVSAEVEILE